MSGNGPMILNSNGDQYVGTAYDPIYPIYGKKRKRKTAELTVFQIGNLQLGEIVRIFILQIEVLINFILEMIVALTLFIFRIISLLSPYLFVFILFVFLYWMAHVGFPYTMKLVVYVGIPLVEMIIIAFNIIFKIVLFQYFIVATIWNAVVPFLGMLLMFVFDILFTILDAVNQILGAIDLGNLFNELMPLINILMEITLQIVQILIQVGEPILRLVLILVVPLIEIIFSVIKILIPIITFLFKVVFFVLQPIIFILQAFFGGGQSNTNGGDTAGGARKLLSVNFFTSTPLKEAEIYAGYEPYAQAVMAALNMTPAEFYTEIYQNTTSIAPDLFSVPQMTGRKPLAYETRKAGLNFKNFEDDEDDINENEDDPEELKKSMHDDDVTYDFVHTFYKSSRVIPRETISQTSTIMDDVMAHFRNTDPLTISAIYASYIQEHGRSSVPEDKRLGAVRYAAEIEHPNDLNERLRQEREAKKIEILNAQQSGRKLLEMVVFPENANEHLNHYMSNLERQHATMVMEQAKLYKEKHTERMQLASTITGAVSMTMKRHAETSFHPDNIVAQWNNLLQSFGYSDIWEWHTYVLHEYEDAARYMHSFAEYFDNPVFDFVKNIHVDEDNGIYFKSWQQEQQKEAGTGRRLFSVEDDNSAGKVGTSRPAFSGFATVSRQNCNTNPKHPLCAPIPPTSIFKFNLPGLGITKEQKSKLLQDTTECSPWIDHVYCIICKERFYNAAVEILFIFMAIPPINYAIATITMIAPWTGFFLNWMFIVPKFKRATTLQWLCFVRETYSLFIVALVVFGAFYFLWPFIMAIYHAFRDIIKIKARKPEENKDVKILDDYIRDYVENPPPIKSPSSQEFNLDSIIAGRIGGSDTHIHHHYNMGSQNDFDKLLSFIDNYIQSGKRIDAKFIKLLGYLGLYKYNLHTKHPDHIDHDAIEEEEEYLDNNPILRIQNTPFN